MLRAKSRHLVVRLALVLSILGMVCGPIAFVFGGAYRNTPLAIVGGLLAFPSILYVVCIYFSYELSGWDYSLLGTKQPAAIPHDLANGPLVSSHLSIPQHLQMSYPLAAWRVGPSGVALCVRIFARQTFYLPWDWISAVQMGGWSATIHHTSPELRSPLVTSKFVGEWILAAKRLRMEEIGKLAEPLGSHQKE